MYGQSARNCGNIKNRENGCFKINVTSYPLQNSKLWLRDWDTWKWGKISEAKKKN